MLAFLLLSLFILYFCLKYPVRKNHLFCPTYSDSSDLLMYQAGRPHAPSSFKRAHAPFMCPTLWPNYLPKAPILTGEQAWGWQRTKTEYKPSLYGFTHHEKTLWRAYTESLTLACVRFTLPVSACHHSAASAISNAVPTLVLSADLMSVCHY